MENGALVHKHCHPKSIKTTEDFADKWKKKREALAAAVAPAPAATNGNGSASPP
jgi:hypothetical protein